MPHFTLFSYGPDVSDAARAHGDRGAETPSNAIVSASCGCDFFVGRDFSRAWPGDSGGLGRGKAELDGPAVLARTVSEQVGQDLHAALRGDR